MTLTEASQKYSLPVRTLRELLTSGLLWGQKVNGNWQVDPKVLEPFLEFSRRHYESAKPKTKPVQKLVKKLSEAPSVAPAPPLHVALRPKLPSTAPVDQDNERNRYTWD